MTGMAEVGATLMAKDVLELPKEEVETGCIVLNHLKVMEKPRFQMGSMLLLETLLNWMATRSTQV
jgi:hypothetical protein